VRTNVYIDGFNLYNGSVRHTPFKWLDIGALCVVCSQAVRSTRSGTSRLPLWLFRTTRKFRLGRMSIFGPSVRFRTSRFTRMGGLRLTWSAQEPLKPPRVSLFDHDGYLELH